MSLNHIYKVVWSKTKGCYIVVSELAKRVGRNKAKAIVISSAAMAMAVSSVMTSTVSATINQAGTGGNESVAFGEQSTAEGSGAVALGKTATASASGAVALGQETKAEKNNGVAIGKGAKSTEDSAIALGFGSKSSGNWSVAIGLQTNATNKQAVAVGSKSQATGENSVAIGNAANASNESSVALGSSTQSTNKYTTAIGGTAFATQEGATALGYGARATATNTIAIGKLAKAEQEGVLALGSASFAQGKDTIAIGNSATAKQVGDIIIGKDAKSRDQGGGRSVAIGFKATAGSNRNGHENDDASTEKRGDDGSVAIGTNAYTGLNKNNTAVNNSVALGAGAGVGYRSVGDDGTPLGVGTDADDNTTVLVKAFGGTTSKLDYFKKTGKAQSEGFFSFQGVDINEGTALGRNTRAIGDQSVAIGAQSVAGMGSIVIGGNDIQAYDQKKYFKAKNPDSGEAKGVNDYNAEVTPGTGKNGQPITITNKYKELVGVGLDRSWRASYGQDGSTVIGMQAHSTTPLGVAIGTNSIVRKGAFGATAIGSGASVVANAEAAVAIGMGSEARGNYAVAAGTAARAKESAVAFGYSSQADVNAVAVGNKSVSKGSAVAVGDESQAVEASVAVGQLAKAKKVADIAVGQGAVASGEQGAIAMGLGTQAQGDSSIMIGGSEITKVAAQTVNYQKEKKDAQGHTIIKSTKKTETIGGEQIERTIRSVEMENTGGTIQQAYGELTNGGTLNTTTLDYSSTTNKNGHGSISMGVHSLSTGDLGTAIGTGARVTKLGGVALGTGAISELQNGVAIGTGSRADMNSIGTRQTDISYDNEGKIVPFDSKKVAYTFYWAGGTNTSEGDVVSFGSPGAERQLKNVAAGRIADDSTDAINGSQLNSVTKRMSSGWAVEAEKDKTSSGVLKLNGATATAGTEVHSANGKATTRENLGTATGNVNKIRLNDEVKIRVGDNLVLHQEDASRPVYEDPDNPDRQTGTRVTSKFTYSLNPELTGLKSAQFKNDAGDTTDINGTGVTVTPVTAGKQPVSLTTTGLNNGGNVISNVAGNLPSSKNNDATTGSSNATTSQAAPMLGNAANQVNPTNAATVSDVLNAGWNLQGNNKAVDFVKPYDTVNFVNGGGTTATVESADGKTSTVKYSVNLGDGLKKDDATNKITVSAADKSLTVGTDGVKVNPGDKSLKTTDTGLTVNTADKSLEVTNDGLKVKTDGTTITTDNTAGLKVVTGGIESVTTGADSGTVEVKDGDKGKIATVDSVVNAVNSAAWIATSAKTTAGELGASPTDQSVKAGDKVTFEADKNIKITQAGSKFTFATRDDVSFNTVQVGGSEGPKFAKAADGSIKVSDKDGAEPVKITNVKDGDISADSKDAINGSQFHKLANNTIQLKGQTGDNIATETKKQELNKKEGIAFTVKSSDGTLLEVSAAEDTITLKPKIASLTTGADGVPTANTTNGKLVTADQLVNTLTEMGWKATVDKDGSGTVSGAATELIKAGNTVTFKAGDNLAVKQDGKNFIYSLQKELTGLTSAEFKNQAGDKTVINSDGVTITPVTNGKQPVSLTKDGLNNGGNPITNVTSNLVNYTDPEVNGVQPAKNSLRNLDDNSVANTNAATVGDLRNMGWIVSSDKTTGANGITTVTAYSEAVKNANEVRFVGEGSAVVSGKTEGNVRTITVKVDSQTGINKTVTPVNYTKADGTKVYPQEVDNGDGTKTVKFFENPDGTGKEIPSTEVITSVNGPKGTTTPATLSNVKSNLPDTKNNDAATGPSNATTVQAAPNTTNKNGDKYINPNNAATVSDVLNAGWNLQGNGTEVDFVKAYDTVNFIDGEGTTATVASTDGKTSTVKYSVNLGKGLQKDDTGNTISVKPADSSLVVDDAGVKVNTGTINNVTTGDKPGTVEANNGDENKVATVGNVVSAINNAAWTATSAATSAGELGSTAVNQLVKSGDKVTFEADKNMKITQDGSKFTFTTKNDVSFDTVQVGGDQGPKLSKTDAGDLKVSGPNGTSPLKVTNVTSGLDKYGDQVNNADVSGTTDKNRGLVDLSKPENGQPKVSDNTAATVGDLRNMGWIVSADKKTGDLTNAYSDTVKNANEVKFVGAGTAIVSGDTVDGVRTITVKVDDQTSTNNAVTPVVYTDKDGKQVYPTGKTDKDGNQIFNTKPDGKGEDVTGPVKTTINGPKGTTSPTILSNVEGNLDGAKTNTKAPTTDATAPNTTDKTGDKYINPNNAATVSDVLNAGWNLQNNGNAKDFVKPFDTVNFVNGGNTTVVVTTNAAGTASDVTFNVTGLPVTNTITENGKEVPVVKVGNTFYPAKPDGTPDIQKGQDGNPTNGYVQADNGKVYPRDAVTITKNQDGTTTVTPNTDATPKTVNTNLVNPNVANTTDKPGNNVSTPNQLGNVANGAKTFEPVDGKVLANDGKWYLADKVSDKGTPEAGAKAVENPLAPKNAAGESLVQAKDGKWYKPSDLQSNGTPTPTAQPQDNAINNKVGLVDFSNSNPNNAATIGDLQNMGWVVSAQGNSYSDQVRNTNEVKFVGEGTASVTGKTDDKGVRTITVKVDDQTSTNNSVTPVNYTKADGTKVYPKTVTDPKTGKEEVKFFENPDGSGAEVPKGDVVTSINGPEGTTSPTTLKNVKNNIPNVNDGSKTITNPDGTEKAGDVENINKAPLTAEEAAALANPKTKDGQANPKYIGNNAATVSDVLNAGWNLQNNGAARDFVKPFDTVNFVNGVNTTAVVTTSEDGTTSNVTYNVTGLPVTYTTADGTPVSKIGDDYYTVNDKGQPIDANGKLSTKVNKDGKPVDENGNVIKPIDTTANPLTSSLVNPNVKNTDTEPNKKTTDPTQLGNVTSGLQKYGDIVDGKEVPGSTKANNGLVDLSTPTDGSKPKVSDNTAATVGDLRNMGWIVSSDKTTGETDKAYTDTVKNANEVKFVGEGTTIVSGKTVDGVRTITVKVDDQVSTNNATMPTSFTTKDGTKVYPVKDDAGNVTYHTTPDGKGTGDTTIDPKNVVTAVNGPKGTAMPTTLQNVKSNLPNVDDKKQKAFHPDGTEVTEPNSTTNTGNAKAPLSHTVVAAMMSPFMTNEEGNFIDENGNVTTDPKKYVRNPNFAANNAATVGDVLSAGWNLQNNGESRDFVKPYDTVNFINGLGTTAVVTTREGKTTSDVTFNVKPANGSVTVDEDGVKVTTGEITPNTNGSVAGPTTPENAKTLKDALDAAVKELATAKDALKTAETALAANPKDPALQKAVDDKKAEVAAKQTPVEAAQKAHDDAGLNKVATVQNVAEAINNAGFNLKTSADGGEKLTGTKDDGELIKPSNTVEMVAGNNLTVKQDANGKITYATKDNVTFTNVDTGTLNVGNPNTYTDGKGNTYTKVGDKYYNPADVVNGAPKQGATPVDVTTPVTLVSPVTMKTEVAKPATNNATEAQPSSALNITSKDGKPTQITGVGSTLNTNVVTTTPEGTATKPGAAPDTKPKTEDAHLVDLNGTADAPVNKNAAATVGDLQNMGWVVSAKDGNGYKNVVKNANVVDFKGGNGIEITGNTLADGTREITVGIKEGEVTNKVTITRPDGKKIKALRVGKRFYKLDKDDKVAGISKDENSNLVGTPLSVNPKEDTITNTGSGVVTGNTVANAIQASGWNIGLGETDKDFSKERKNYDKVNPNDHVKFVDGANANVSMVTVDGVNADGIKEETTFIKVDVNRNLKIDSVTTGGTAVDKNGNNLVKVGDDYYKESDIDPVTKQPKGNAKAVPKTDVTTAKDGEMLLKDATGKDGVSATAKDGKGTLTLNNAKAGKDGKDAASVAISTDKAPADLDNTPKDAVRANDGKWYAPADVDVKTKDGKTVVTPKAGKSPMADAPTMDRIQYKGTDGKLRDVATMDDGLRFQGDDGESISKPLNSTVQLTGGNREDTGKPVAKDATTTGNIGVFNTDGKLSVQLAKDLDKLNSANFESKTDKAGNPLKVVDGQYYPEKAVVKEGKVYPEGTVIIDNKPYPAGTTKDAAGKVVNNGKPATEATPINPIDSKQVQDGPTSKLTGTGLTFNTPTPKDEKGNPLVLVDGKYYKADNLENGKPKAGAKPEPVKPAQSTAFTPDGLVVTPETAKVRDANGNPVLDQDGREVVDPTKVVSFGSPTIAVDPNTGKPMVDANGNPVMKSGISAGGQVMANVAPGVLDTDAVNVSQLKGVSNAVINVNNRMNRMGAQAAALAGLQTIQYDPLEPTQISAGLGYYKGSSAVALGMNHFKNESTMFHMGASLNGHGDETMVNASVTWKFGDRADETAVRDTFRQGPISASYTLQDKVSALEAQTRVQKEQLKTIKGLEKQVELLKELNEKQQEQITELFKRLSEK